MDLTKAILLATQAHAGQLDKGNNEYILHPLSVMLKMSTVEERIVATLHDIVEDTHITLANLIEQGFSRGIVDAVDALTRRQNETYKEFILRIKENELATAVKIQDIMQNKDLSRIPEPTEQDISRIKRYDDALVVLLEGAA